MIKKVAIVEDDPGLRDQLTQILTAARGVSCVVACASGEEALESIPARMPDVVLMDIKLPGMSGIECVAQLKRLLPAVQIIMLTVYEDSDRIFRALKAGADGYLVKSSPPEVLLDAIDNVQRGGSPISSAPATGRWTSSRGRSPRSACRGILSNAAPSGSSPPT